MPSVPLGGCVGGARITQIHNTRGTSSNHAPWTECTQGTQHAARDSATVAPSFSTTYLLIPPGSHSQVDPPA